ncbi:N-acetyltransferase [Dysgonomonas sp. 521]|nr:N-acetyltransferase [Dysgonomonas sp. 521]
MNNKEFEIRQEIANDYPAVYALNSAAFGRKDEARLTDRLRSSDAFIPELSLVATIDNKVVGYILFTKINIVEGNITVSGLALAPMAVSPDMQKQGIGSQLIYSGLDKAKMLGYKSVVVLGHESYYPRFGFVPTTKWGIKAPFNVPTNVFMGLELVEDGLKGITGTVIFAKEFGDI